MAIEVFDRSALELFNAEEAIQKIAEGFQFTEGPVWDDAHSRLIFSDIPANTIFSWSDEGSVVAYRQPSNFSNGLILDRAGRLLACEHQARRVSRTVSAVANADGPIEVLASHYEGKRLNSPNDLVEATDGSIIFTDPTYGLLPNDQGGPGDQEQPCQGVYRIVPGQAEPVRLADDFIQPNGIALSPDEKTLYVDDSVGGHIRAFSVGDDWTVSGGDVLVDFGDMTDVDGVPDGMKLDAQGNIYCTGPSGVWIANPGGLMLAHIVPPEVPANVAWGDADRQTLYMTARTGLYRMRFLVAGQRYGQ